MLEPYQPSGQMPSGKNKRSTSGRSKKWMGWTAGILACACLAGGGLFFAFQSGESKAGNYICRSVDETTANTNSLSLTVDEKGNIVQAVSKNGFDKSLMLQMMAEDGYDTSEMHVYYNQLADYYLNLYSDTTAGNENLDWFRNEMEINKDEYRILLTSKFDLTTPNFHPDDEATQTFLDGFALNYFLKDGTYKYSDEGAQALAADSDGEIVCVKFC